MLLSAAPGRLLPTIRSRCQLLNLPLPDSDSATEWLRPLVGDGVSTLLRFGRGRPVQALHLFESGAVEQLTTIADQYQLLRRKEISPIALAQKWNEYSLSTVLDTLLGEVDDELRAKLLQQSAGAKARDRFIKARDSIVLLQQRIQNGLNPNAQLALEDILLQLR